MPRVDAVVTTPIHDSFRVQQVAGMFDLPVSERSEQSFAVDLPGLDEPWTIGAIVGPSGSGKSTIARKAYGLDGRIAAGCMVDRFDWPKDKAVVDGFDAPLDGRAITGMLNCVGFSSPPAWVRPWDVLSNGERFRCDLARALLTERELIVFDEFTSVVDRQVARFGSAAIAKTLRNGRARCKRFIAVTCHYDVLGWLEPDWHIDMATRHLARGRVQQRPAIELHIHRCHRELWSVFGRHHYLSGKLHGNARCYAATWNDNPVGFCATIPLFGKRGRRIVHRLVVLPDYQGLGVCLGLLNAVAQHEAKTHVMSIVTSHPALVRALARQDTWRCTHVNKCGIPHQTVMRRTGRKIGSVGRMTASFRFVGEERRAA